MDRIRTLVSLLAVSGLAAFSQPAGAQQERGFEVAGEVTLSSLKSFADGHLRKMADFLHVLAESEAGRSGDWERIRGPLADLAERNTPALN